MQVLKIEKIEESIFSPIRVKDVMLNSIELLKDDISYKLEEHILNKQREDFLKLLTDKCSLFSEKDLSNPNNIVHALLNFTTVENEFTDFFLPNSIMLLNFNYTDTDDSYLNSQIYNHLTSNTININLIIYMEHLMIKPII